MPYGRGSSKAAARFTGAQREGPGYRFGAMSIPARRGTSNVKQT